MTIQDDNEMKTPEARVGSAIRGLQSSVTDLVELRHENATADFVMRDEHLIRAEHIALLGLIDDLWNAKQAAE